MNNRQRCWVAAAVLLQLLLCLSFTFAAEQGLTTDLNELSEAQEPRTVARRQRRRVVAIEDEDSATHDADALLDALWEFEGGNFERELMGSKKSGKKGSSKKMMMHSLSFRYI
jgi:hypothetical protein